MPSPRRQESYGRAAYVVVDHEDAKREAQAGSIEAKDAVVIVHEMLQRSNPEHGNAMRTLKNFSIGQKDDDHAVPQVPAKAAPSAPSPSAALSMGMQRPTTALANTNPTATAPVALSPDYAHRGTDGISQATEHFLIAAGSIGATIIVVMIAWAIYTMHKRRLTFKDLLRPGSIRARSAKSSSSQYPMDNKQGYEDAYAYSRSNPSFSPPPAALTSRSSSLSNQTFLKPLGRSESISHELPRSISIKSSMRDFIIQENRRSNSHQRDNSAAASSILLPIQDRRRQSISTHNTRSTEEEEHEMQVIAAPNQLNGPPAPPTFSQFLSNRPNISQRPPAGGPIASRFSWTNSQAPQTPHEPSRNTAAHVERDSFMTQRSSVPRFRTVDSWVNQQSNQIEARRLKEQFRLTQSTMYSIEDREVREGDIDEVPEMPALPKNIKDSSGLVGKEVKNKKHESLKSTLTAPIFKAHPGTEVRFSTHSTVPSEVLDMDRRNAVL